MALLVTAEELGYRADLARFYCANLTPVEAADSLAFWSSPTGAKVVSTRGLLSGWR